MMERFAYFFLEGQVTKLHVLLEERVFMNSIVKAQSVDMVPLVSHCSLQSAMAVVQSSLQQARDQVQDKETSCLALQEQITQVSFVS